MEPQPIILEGTYVRLEPLTMEHLPGLCEVGLDPELWRWTPNIQRTPDDMRNYIQAALRAQEQGTALPFATREQTSGLIVGSTRFGNIDRENMGVEIGWTWIAQPWQRTPINTEAKYLMLRYAFEKLGCIRVQLKTDSLNTRSRSAIVRLGAREEGVLRNHMLTYSGRIRHTAFYSIINSEWPLVQSRLEDALQRPFEPRP
jgi:RimJ/RimL family protein N-acetyltransferase